MSSCQRVSLLRGYKGTTIKLILMSIIILLSSRLNSAEYSPALTIFKEQINAYSNYLCALPDDVVSSSDTSYICDEHFKADIESQKNELKELKEHLLSNLTNTLLFRVPSLSCEIKDGELNLKLGTSEPTQLPIDQALSQLDALAFKPILAILELQELAFALQNKTAEHTAKAQQQLCNAYQAQQKFVTCYQQLFQPGNTGQNASQVAACLAHIEHKELKEVMVVELSQTLGRYLPEISPFLLEQLQQQQTVLETALDDYAQLQQLLNTIINNTLQQYVEWKSNIAIIHYIARQDAALTRLLGIDHKKFQQLAKKLADDSYQNISDLSEEAYKKSEFKRNHDTLKAQIKSYKQQASQLVNNLKTQLQQLANNWQQEVKQAVTDYVVEQTSPFVEDSLGQIGLSFSFEQQKELINNQVAYRASLYYHLNQDNIILEQNCNDTQVSCLGPDGNSVSTNIQAQQAYEKIELGIYIDDIGINKEDSGQGYNYKYLGKALRANTRVDEQKLRAALFRLGLPNVIQFKNISIVASTDLQNITLQIPVTILAYNSGKVFDLKVVENGKIVAPVKAITTFVEQTAQAEINRAIQRRLQDLPYLQASLSPNDLKLTFDATSLTLKYQMESSSIKGSFAFNLNKGPQLVGIIPISFDLTHDGVNFTKVTLDKTLRKAIDAELRNQLTSVIAPDVLPYIEQIIPILKSRSFGFQLALSGELLGCRMDTQLYLDYPFNNIKDMLKNSLDGLTEQAQNCAQHKAIELAWKQVPAIDFTQPLNLFGIEFQYIDHERISATEYKVSIKASLDNKSLIIEQLPLVYNNGHLGAHLHKAQFHSKDAEEYLAKLVQPILEMTPENLLIERAGIDKGGIYFYATLLDLPYLGDVPLGKLFISSAAQDIHSVLLNATKTALTSYLNKELTNALDIPDLGPLENISPNISITPKLIIGIAADLKLYDDLKLPVKIDLLPFKIHQPNIDDALKQSVLATLTSLAPSQFGVFEFISPPQLKKIPEHGVYGVSFGAKIDLGFLGVVFNRVALSSKGIILPKEVGASIPLAINLGYVVISEAGMIYNTREPRLVIFGDVTAVEASLAHIAKIQSKLDLTDLPDARFVLEGNLIAANTLSILKARGEVALKEAMVSYEAHSNPMFESIIKADSEGLIDGKAQIFSTQSSLSLLGLKLNENDFIISVPEDVIRFKGGERLLIGWAEFGVLTNTKFKDPTANASFELDLSGWKALDADLKVSLALAKLKMNVLGIKVKVITPSVQGLTPQLLLNILSNLLKVDIKSLLKMKLDDITISVLDSQGNVQQVSEASSDKEQEGDGNPPQEDDSENSDGDSKQPVPEEERASEIQPQGGGSTIGDIPVTNYCSHVANDRYVYESVRVGYSRPKYNKSDLSHRFTFNKQARELLCSDNGVVKGEWIEVHKKNNQGSLNCNTPNSRLDYSINQVYAKWAPDAEKSIFCGITERPEPKCYQSQLYFDDIASIEVKDYQKITASKNNSLDQEHYRHYYINTPEELALYQKAHEKIMNEEICAPWRYIQLHYEFDDGIFIDDYTVSATVDFHPYFSELEWHQTFKLFYNTSDNKFYALSTCIDPDFLANDNFAIDDLHNKVCDAGLFTLPTVHGYADAIAKKAIILNNADEYFLVDDAAATYSQTGQLPQTQPVQINFVLEGISYQGTEFLPSNGLNYKNYYITKNDGKTASDHSFTINEQEPLYPWFTPELFRDELIAEYVNGSDLNVWHQDISKNQLILNRPQYSADRVSTYWLRKDKKPLAVTIDLTNPYRNGRSLTDSEKHRLIRALYTTVISSKEDRLHISLGLDRDQQLDTLLIKSTDNFTVILTEAGNKLLADPIKINNQGRRVSGSISAFENCLQAIGVALPMVTVLKEPGTVYEQYTPAIYPLNLLDLEECKNVQN